MDKKTNVLSYLINLSFFLYFIILIVERALSVILSITNKVNLYGNAFHGYTYTLVFISIAAFLVYLIIRCRPNIKALFHVDPGVGYRDLCIASGILLLSGMVHTEYTISGIQFASYGILIVGILLRVILNAPKAKSKFLLWLSFAYLVSFSMAIPVMYPSAIELHVLFHIVEAVASVALVAIFTLLMILLFEEHEDLFFIVPIVLVVVFDSFLIGIRWTEEINYFVLIFAVLSFILFTVGLIYKAARVKDEPEAK